MSFIVKNQQIAVGQNAHHLHFHLVDGAEDFRLLPGRTALENVSFALEVTGTPPKAIQSRANRLLTQVGLSPKAGAFVNELSGGEQQRVAIARALVNDPFVLLADEPTGNLDSLMARQVLELLEAINEAGSTIVMVTHDSDLARRARRNIHVLDGQVDDYTVYDSLAAARPMASSDAAQTESAGL